MATFGSTVRRGLPRTPGGEPWPPAGTAPVGAAPVGGHAAGADAESARGADAAGIAGGFPPVVTSEPSAESVRVAEVAGIAGGFPPVATPGARSAGFRVVRRGLPRVRGGEPWPPADFAPAAGAVPVVAAVTPPAVAPAAPAAPAEAPVPASVAASASAARTAAPAAPAATGSGETVIVRRGLPRVKGGEPWPPAGFAAAVGPEPTASPVEEIVVEQVASDGAAVSDAVAPVAAGPTRPAASAATGEGVGTAVDVSTPLPFTRTVWQGAAAARFEQQRRSGVKSTRPEPTRLGPFTRGQWAGVVVVGGGGLLFAAGMAVLLVRWLLSTEWGTGFLGAFPGEYELPAGAPVGFPAWLGWQHFFNVFLMVLIIRSGLRVRTEKRPTAFWAPRKNPRGKISLTLWFHQALDILWLVNGVIFVVLLFVTGQWMRVIPTSWEVFPNAVSAILQYISLDWPTENGWVNYNAIQQLAYFVTIFVAAPVAAISGFRMSGLWPKNAKGLSRAYPVEWARAVHFPVMLYFVAFIIVHVILVFATGALRNLNHMYAAQGSTDPTAYAANWTGFWLFVASLAVIVAAWVAARPLTLAPLARLFGSVSGR